MSPSLLLFGLPRSGTQSIANALVTLGVPKVYHMREVGINDHQEIWAALIRKKMSGEDIAAIKPSIKDMLHEYDAIIDFPATIFVRELIEMFPDAQKVLVTREKEAWKVSMSSTLVHAHNSSSGGPPSRMQSLAKAYHKYCWDDDFELNGGRYYDGYSTLVKDAAGDATVLEYSVQDGWQPLCGLLGRAVPEVDFPSADHWRDYKRQHQTSQEL